MAHGTCFILCKEVAFRQELQAQEKQEGCQQYKHYKHNENQNRRIGFYGIIRHEDWLDYKLDMATTTKPSEWWLDSGATVHVIQVILHN